MIRSREIRKVANIPTEDYCKVFNEKRKGGFRRIKFWLVRSTVSESGVRLDLKEFYGDRLHSVKMIANCRGRRSLAIKIKSN